MLFLSPVNYCSTETQHGKIQINEKYKLCLLWTDTHVDLCTAALLMRH